MNFDEEPVGQHKELNIDEQASFMSECDAYPKSDPLSERTLSKNVKVRLIGMTELLELFSSCEPEVLIEYYPYFPKYLSDIHPKIQETGCEAFLILINKYQPPIDRILMDIIIALVEKCLVSSKESIKTKSLDCLLGLAENGNTHSIIKETIITRLSLKVNSKVASASLCLLTQLLKSFGNKCFPVNDFVDLIVELAGSNSTNTRIEAANFMKEGYRWDKEVILKAMEGLRPVQKEELKKQFTDTTELPTPVRVIKSGIQKVSIAEEIKKALTELPSPTESSQKFDDHWCGQIVEEKKWIIKRDMLDELFNSISVERIKSESIPELGKTLKLLLQDPNLAVSNSALRAIGQMAKVFKNQFSVYAKNIFDMIIQKFKDKKSSSEAQKCLENLTFSLRLEDMIDTIKEILNNKSPLIKAKVCTWIANVILPKIEVPLDKVVAETLGPILSKLTDDAASDVRDSALNCLSIMKYYIHDPKINQLIEELNPQKQERIDRIVEQKLLSQDPTRISILDGSGISKIKLDDEKISLNNSFSPHKATPKRRKKNKTVSAITLNNLSQKATSSATRNDYEVIASEDIGPAITPGNATKEVFENVPTMILAQFDMLEWKERQKGFKYLNEWAQCNPDKVQLMLESIIVWLRRKFGSFKDASQEMIIELFSFLQTICDKCKVNKRFAFDIVPILVVRMKDDKLVDQCIQIALSIAKSANPSYVAALAIKACYESKKNIQIMKGGMILLRKMLDDYGSGLLPIKVTIEYAKDCLPYSVINNIAVQYIVAVYRIMGDSIQPWLKDLNGATQKILKAEFLKIKSQFPDVNSCDNEINNTKTDIISKKVDISSKLTPQIIAGISANLTKNRQEAKNEIETILQEANNNIEANGLTPLMLALKGRMNEPCRNLLKGFINLIGNIAVAAGDGFKQYSKIIMQSLMTNLSDKQTEIRAETLEAMDKIANSSGFEVVFNNLIPILEFDNTDGRNLLLIWIIKHKNQLANCDMQKLINPLIILIQDKSKEIRELSEQIIREIIEQFGDTMLVSAMKDLRPVAKCRLENVINNCKSGEENNIEMECLSADEDKVTKRDPYEEVKTQRHLLRNTVKNVTVEGSPEKASNNNERSSKEFEDRKSNYNSVRLVNESRREKNRNSNTRRNRNRDLAKTKSPIKIRSSIKGESNIPTLSIAKNCASPLSISYVSEETFRKAAETYQARDRSGSRSACDLKKAFRGTSKTRIKERAGSRANKRPNCKANIKLGSGFTTSKDYSGEPVNIDIRVIKRNDSRIENRSPVTEEEDSTKGPTNVIIQTLGNKEGRAEIDRKLKWPINQVKKEKVDKLKRTLKNCIEPKTFELMFSNQPKKIVNSLKVLNRIIETEYNSLIDLLDLIYKWVVVKSIEQTSAIVLKALIDFLLCLFNKMQEEKYQMLGFEASVIIPMFCDKLDTSNTGFRHNFKELLKISAKIYDPTKITTHLMNELESGKSNKGKLECINLIKEFIKLYDVNKIFMPKDIKKFVKLMNSSDSTLKSKSLDILTEIYNVKGDAIWSLLGRLNNKTTEILRKKFNIADYSISSIKKSSILSNDEYSNVNETRLKPSQKRIMAQFNENMEDSSISIETMKVSTRKASVDREDFSSPTFDKEYLSPSESESLFSGAGKPENDYRLKSLQNANGVLVTSMDDSKNQDEEEIIIENLDQALEVLKCESISKRVNSLMYLNEKTISTLEEEKDLLVINSDKLLLAFADVLNELFNKPVEDIPIRFTKYFMTVVSKVCANKAIVNHTNEKTFSLFIEQVLTRLLYEGLEKMGENNEGQYLIKALNLTMLRILEFYDPTKLFAILINLFIRYKDISTKNVKMAKLPSLIAKCILKLAKSIGSIIEILNVPKVLLSLHEYLLIIPSNAIPKSSSDDIGIRMAKTVVYELIKVRGEDIWEDYKIIELHKDTDLHLQRWINLILGSYYPTPISPTKPQGKSSLDELQEICKGLNSQETFKEAISKLSQFSQVHPEVNLVEYFSPFAKPLQEFVLSSLERYNNKMRDMEVKSMEVIRTEMKSNDGRSADKNAISASTTMNSISNVSPSVKSNSISEYKSKLELLKQKFDIGIKKDKPYE